MSKRLIGGVLAVVVIAGVVIAVIALGGNGDNKTSSTTKTNANTNTAQQPSADNQEQKAEATNSVTIQDYTFGPATITVKVGTKVTWTNQDPVGHTVTADTGNGPDSELIDQGKSYSFTFDTAGTYNYHCTPHPYMKGTVIVTE